MPSLTTITHQKRALASRAAPCEQTWREQAQSHGPQLVRPMA